MQLMQSHIFCDGQYCIIAYAAYCLRYSVMVDIASFLMQLMVFDIFLAYTLSYMNSGLPVFLIYFHTVADISWHEYPLMVVSNQEIQFFPL